VVLAELFDGFGSSVVSVAFTDALIVPAAFVVTTTVIFGVAPAFTVPRVHITVVVPEHVPCDAVADTNVTDAGSVTVATAPAPASGPRFDTLTV
jgi:hypothetical protein